MDGHVPTTAATASQGRRPVRRAAPLRRIAPAVGLFFLAPLLAEYLLGYDASTGDLGALLAGLVIFAPLVGGMAPAWAAGEPHPSKFLQVQVLPA